MTASLQNNRSSPENDASIKALGSSFFLMVSAFWSGDRHVLDLFEYDRKEGGDERRGTFERFF